MKRIQSIALSLTLASSTLSFAESRDLLSLYQQAVNYDASIAAAKANLDAEKINEDLAMASLLPSLNASASTGHSDANRELSNDDSYYTTRYSVSLTQSIFNMPSWYGLSSAELNSLRAQAVYLGEQQDLILNVASAYFNVLREQENLTTTKAAVAAFQRQYEQAREQFDVGLIAITDVHEAKATYDSAQTTRIRSEGNLTLAIENLSRITGEYATDLDTLKDDFPITLDKTGDANKWAEAAMQNSLSIKAAEYGLKSLEADLRAKKSGHYPQVNLSASYDHNDFDGIYPQDNETVDKTLFLSLDLPLYSGGAVQAGVRQTRSQVEQAKHQLNATQRQAKLEARSEYINLVTNLQTVDSLKQNIISRESALEATREGYNVGTRNIVEVLDAERNYFTALRDYANARFDFVESSLRLKRSVGTLSEEDLKALNAWLAPRS